MTNCPNCSAPISPYTWKCPYCSTIYFNFAAMDLEDGHPCFVKFKTSHGTITALAKPKIGIIEMSSDTSYISDKYDNKIMSYITNRNCDINVRFECRENPKTKELFRIEAGGRN